MKPVPQGEALRFAVLGDCHSHRTIGRFLRDAVENRNAFAIQLGDFVDYDEDLEYHHFFRRCGDIPLPLYLVRGNHEAASFDLEESDRAIEYAPNLGFTSLVVGSVRFIILDSSHGSIKQQHLDDVAATIAASRKTNPKQVVFILTHYPPNVPGKFQSDLQQLSSRALLDLCDSHKVNYLLSGHVHRYEQFEHSGTSIIVDGCGGGSLVAPSDEVHYLQFEVAKGAVSFAKVPLASDNAALAKLDYFVFITMLRYRWWFLIAAAALILRELVPVILRQRKKRRVPKNLVTSA